MLQRRIHEFMQQPVAQFKYCFCQHTGSIGMKPYDAYASLY